MSGQHPKLGILGRLDEDNAEAASRAEEAAERALQKRTTQRLGVKGPFTFGINEGVGLELVPDKTTPTSSVTVTKTPRRTPPPLSRTTLPPPIPPKPSTPPPSRPSQPQAPLSEPEPLSLHVQQALRAASNPEESIPWLTRKTKIALAIALGLGMGAAGLTAYHEYGMPKAPDKQNTENGEELKP